MADGTVRVLRAADRFHTQRESTSTTHAFSFADHYDPERISFGPLVAHNVERLQPGGGYLPHLHRDVEIVSWVVAGTLEHRDDHGHITRLEAGSVQRLTAAAGATHAEVSAVALGGPETEFVQLWLRCPAGEHESDPPTYEHAVVEAGDLRTHWVALASSDPIATPRVRLQVSGVTLWARDLPAGETSQLPSGSRAHLYVVSGAVELGTGEQLRAQDSAMLHNAGSIDIQADQDAQILTLTMPGDPSALNQ